MDDETYNRQSGGRTPLWRSVREHLTLRAEAIWNFQPPLLPAPRPWWKLWGKDPEIELPAIVADLRNIA